MKTWKKIDLVRAPGVVGAGVQQIQLVHASILDNHGSWITRWCKHQQTNLTLFFKLIYKCTVFSYYKNFLNEKNTFFFFFLNNRKLFCFFFFCKARYAATYWQFNDILATFKNHLDIWKKDMFGIFWICVILQQIADSSY